MSQSSGAWVLLGLICSTPLAVEKVTPEERAIAYLSREVPQWSSENRCFSCHNNGDGARVLYSAHQLRKALPPNVLDGTSAFLAKPSEWDKNGPEGPFKDKRLARLQFAAALRGAVEAGSIREREAMQRAGELIAEIQDADGSWPIDGGDELGSPVTHGRLLRTHFGRQVLQKADAERHRDAIVRAEKWLTHTKLNSVLDAASVLLAFPDQPRGTSDARTEQRTRALELIRKGQSEAGGWGPYVTSPPEAFDTAIVVIALAVASERADFKASLAKGRTYLLSLQKADGSWEETTRPSGAESYAQRVSTTAWALQALLATREMR